MCFVCLRSLPSLPSPRILTSSFLLLVFANVPICLCAFIGIYKAGEGNGDAVSVQTDEACLPLPCIPVTFVVPLRNLLCHRELFSGFKKSTNGISYEFQFNSQCRPFSRRARPPCGKRSLCLDSFPPFPSPADDRPATNYPSLPADIYVYTKDCFVLFERKHGGGIGTAAVPM